MRVISGNLKGKIIQTPTDKNTRPLRDMVKESIFNILEHSKYQKIEFKDGIVLDLFSGSGSFGIECLSRGVKKVYFIENHKPSLKILKKNLDDLKLYQNSVIIEKNVYEISNKNVNDKKIDLIYLDPPFKDKNINKLLKKIKNFKLAQSNTLIIIHRNKKYKDELITEFKIFREQTYGISKIIFGRILF